MAAWGRTEEGSEGMRLGERVAATVRCGDAVAERWEGCLGVGGGVVILR